MPRFLFSLLCCIIYTQLLCRVQGEYVSEDLRVTLKHGGVLIGRHMTSAGGSFVRGFLGIPYAQPPIGELRFRAPLPTQSWKGERLAIADGNICSQIDVFSGSYAYSGDEDCLYLNVYVPQEPKTKEPLPVIVWIPGGGFVGGDGMSQLHNPKRLMDRDIVFVSINYRLSTLGFLSSETLDIPGNFALKDQLMALKWVKEHVSTFGGDENSITIFGGSAGAASVAYHTFSEKAKGLFHRAIAASGTFYNSWAKPAPKGYAANLAKKVADSMGCGLENNLWQKTLNCLRSVPARNLTEAFKQFLVWDYTPMPPLPIVIEIEHEEAYLTQPPQVTAYSNSLPLMLGYNKDEGMMFLLLHSAYSSNFEQFKNEMETYFQYAFDTRFITKANEKIVRRSVFDYYFKNNTITKSQNLTDSFTDASFINGIDEHIRHRLSKKYPSAPTYLYEFRQKGQISFSYKFSDEFQGVCHGDDLYYFFPMGEQDFPSNIPNKRDRELTENILDLWYNFAAVGDPSPANTYLPRWKPINSYPPKIMRIGSINDVDPLLEFSEDYPTSRANFWHELQPYLEPVPITDNTLKYDFL